MASLSATFPTSPTNTMSRSARPASPRPSGSWASRPKPRSTGFSMKSFPGSPNKDVMAKSDSTAAEKLAIVVPVYNEGENFPALRKALLENVRTPFEVFVVYDFDEDTTVPAVQRAIDAGDQRFHLVKNSAARGVVGALRTGFQKVQNGPLLVMMGDLSDDLIIVDQMVALYRQGAHVVVASRYMKGGQQSGGPLLKLTISRCARLSLHYLRA